MKVSKMSFETTGHQTQQFVSISMEVREKTAANLENTALTLQNVENKKTLY